MQHTTRTSFRRFLRAAMLERLEDRCTPATTNVAVEPILGVPSLVFTDLVGTTANNVMLKMNVAKTHIEITDPSTVLTTNNGIVSNGGHTVTVSLSAFPNGRIQINTAGGDDTITLDFANGTIDPTGTGSLFINAGTETDTFKIVGAGSGYARYITGLLATAPTSGSIRFTPTGAATIQHFLSNVESISIAGVGTLDLLTRMGNDQVNFAKLNATEGRVTGSSGEVNNSPQPFIPLIYSATSTFYYYSSNGDVAGTHDNLTFINTNGLQIPGLKNFIYSGGAAFDYLEFRSANDLVLPEAGGQVFFNGGGSGDDTLVVVGNTNFTINNSRVTPATGGFVRHVNIERLGIIGGSSANTINASAYSGALLIDGLGGDDILTSGSGRSMLVGGFGSDTLNGGTADDILIGGRTTFNLNSPTMFAIADEWLSAADYVSRVNHLKTPNTGLNGPAIVTTTNAPDEGVVDTLRGNGGLDWFFTYLSDALVDKLGTELVQ